ncbi:MAG TPA: T9SS type A sorting domain-containing protein, partial [Marinilabiliaceae bacterium]|nr:T9SS type A sorting domain-containing protein [Marinilabiliaceae bacterium]
AEENVISSEAAFSYTMPAKDATLTANFELVDYQLSLNADPNAGGFVSNGGAFNMGAIVAVYATPAKGYHFVNWTDAEENVISSEAVFDYTMPAKDATLTANFEVITLLNITEETKLLVWPNPFDIEINIKGGSSIKHISIVTQLGEIIFKTALPVSQIQTSHFSPGVYILKIEDDAGQFTIYKLIKK